MTKFYFYIIISILAIFTGFNASAQTCTFTGGASGTDDRWNRNANWDCGSRPDPESDNVVIPAGFNVRFNNDLQFKDVTLTINGSLDMGNNKIVMTSNSFLRIGSTGSLTNINELFFDSGAGGEFENGATVVVSHLKNDDNSAIVINNSIDVTSKLENQSSVGISGSGSINYDCSNDDFTNDSEIFGCTAEECEDCTLQGVVLLPVEFIAYNTQANYNQKAIEVLWSTATEENSASFVIERSSNGFDFSPIGNVRAAGNSEDISNYTFSDSAPIYGTAYYRIKQIDIDGTFTYTNVMAQRYKNNLDAGSLSLSISQGALQLNFPEFVEAGQLEVINQLGQLVARQEVTVNAFNTIIPQSYLKDGFYIIRFSSKQQMWTRKVLVNR